MADMAELKKPVDKNLLLITRITLFRVSSVHHDAVLLTIITVPSTGAHPRSVTERREQVGVDEVLFRAASFL